MAFEILSLIYYGITYKDKIIRYRMQNLNQVENEKIFSYTLDNILQFNLTQEDFLKSKIEGVQEVSRQIVHLHHILSQRGDYNS